MLVLFSALFLATPAALSAETGATPRPNIVFFLSDDHTTQAIGAYGSTFGTTPNIDRIARDGMRFNQAFCTESICAPSRTA